MTDTRTLRVRLDGARDYDILIGSGLIARAGETFRERFGPRRFFIVRDAHVSALAHTLEASLKAAGHDVQTRALIEGEGAKTWDALQLTVNWLMEERVDRDCMVIALGGGVAGDHAGFAAAVTLRGLDYIQIPTTLLAQVDSSVGGKTGINADQGKNLIGAFHQPRLVMADTDTLASLPPRQLHAGYAEIVKYAFINDSGFFDWLEKHGSAVIAREPNALTHAVATSCANKAAIVGADEREASGRALLNFGHTFGHALEGACKFDRRLLHGEAVAIGMALAFDTSVRMGLCPAADAARAIAHIKRVGLPTRIADIKDFPAIHEGGLIDLMAHDKKTRGGRLTFILSRGIGHAFVSQDADIMAVRSALEASF